MHSRKNLPPSAILKIFKDFSKKNPSIFPKKPKFRTFWEFLPFQSLSMASLLPLAILKKSRFSLEKHIYFSKETQLRNFISLVAFCSQFATIWWKNNFTFRREQNADVGLNAIGKHRVKKTSEIAHLRGRFCFHILNMAQNNKLIEG